MLTNKKKSDDEEFSGSVESLFKIYTESNKGKMHHIYLSESVESNHGYAKLCHFLRSTDPGDHTIIYLSNHGGSCASGYQLINAVRQSPGQVHMMVDAPCYSMGALLAVAGDSLQMNPNTLLMFHNYSGGSGGKGREMLDLALQHDVWLQGAVKNTAYPFLSKKELTDIAADKDVYVHWDDPALKERIKRHFKN